MANRTVTGRMRKTTGTIIAISLRPPSSMSARRPSSRTSWAWARSTSARGVPRSTATTMPSTNRDRLIRPVRSARPCRAVGRFAPARASARQRRSSSASSPCESRQTRSSAPTAPSPALTASASSSATWGTRSACAPHAGRPPGRGHSRVPRCRPGRRRRPATSRTDRQRRCPLGQPTSSAEDDSPTTRAAATPDDLLGAEPLDVRPAARPAAGGGAPTARRRGRRSTTAPSVGHGTGANSSPNAERAARAASGAPSRRGRSWACRAGRARVGRRGPAGG